MYQLDGDAQISSMLARWTNTLVVDEFVALFQGNSQFQVEDLLELVELMDRSSRNGKYSDAGE